MKENMKRKILIGVLTIIFSLILFSLTMQANASEEVTQVGSWDVSADDGESNVTATLYSDGSFIISGTGAMKNYISSLDIPYYDNKSNIKIVKIESGVTGIGNCAFYNCTSLESIEIPEGVTSIGNWAFSGCKSLTSIEIPEGVTSIESSAFNSCSSLTNINVESNNKKYSSENGVLFNKEKTNIIKYPEGKKETEYKIPEGVTSIGYSTFSYCTSLESIDIPNSVTSIESDAFENCSSLTNINVENNNKNYSSENGVLFNKEKTNIIKYPEGKKETEYKIPEGVTSIGAWAFSGCKSLTSIEIPEGVTSIGHSAFRNCTSLESIEIPSSVTSIRYDAFYGCKSLTSIEIPEGVTSIENSAFSGCSSLEVIEIPEGVTSIGYMAFKSCSSLESIEIPEGVTSIGSYAFYYCTSLESIEIPNSVTNIGDDAFYRAKLTMVVASGTENVQEIELPNIIKRAMKEEDILYTANDFTLKNCSLSEDKTKLVVDTEVASSNEVSLKVTEGALEGLTVVVVPSGTIAYSTTQWTNKDIIAKIYVANGETITNNNGKDTYTFTENGTFTFKYLTEEGEEKEATATVENIDKTSPTISKVEGNPTQWTKDNVTLTVNANDSLSGLATKGYSFDGGETWQESNQKTYNENTENIVIKVRDSIGNIATYETINITKIDKASPTINSVTGNPTQWTKDNVTLTVNASDSLSGIAIKGYSFDGGETWQASNQKTYNENTENIVIKVRDSAGNIATYETINITKIEELSIKNYEVTEENGEKYIESIKAGTTIQQVLNNIETNGTAKVYKGDTKITDENKESSTAMSIKIAWGTVDEETYTLVVTGDLSGDGQIGNVDLLKIARYNAGLDTSLEGAYLKAADVYRDGAYGDNKDLLKTARVLAGLENL